MKKILISIILLTVLSAREPAGITLLKWIDPNGLTPDRYEEWIKQHPFTKFNYKLDKIAYGDNRAGTVAILTQQTLAQPLVRQLNQLIKNLNLEGYTVLSYQVSGGTPETLRAFLKNLYENNHIEGAFFIGYLPVCWFEIANDFNEYGYVQFPCDLFYMDLDGSWIDTMNTGNGKYDGHQGEINPEIYIGRLTPTGIGDDTLLLQNYFRKDNAYRFDTLELQHRALIFLDDDWIPWAPQWAYDVSLLYPDTANYWHAETTRASVYRVKLNTPRAWVAVFAHSSPSGHAFYYNNHSTYDWYYSTEYTSQNPPANFYNHFACSFARYTTNGYGGGRAIFNQSYGLGAIGSTKTGSMLEFTYFYEPLAQKKNLGQAFKEWFYHITCDGVDFMELCWHYGMTLLADPFLKPTGHIVSIAEKTEHQASKESFNIRGGITHKKVLIQFNVDKPSDVSISAYDCLGRRVKILFTQNNVATGTKIFWDFTDHQNQALPGGTYLIFAQIGANSYYRKVVKF